MLQNGTAPYFTYQNRALFRSALVVKVFEFAQEYLEVPNGTLKQLFSETTASFN
jgi:malate synthase